MSIPTNNDLRESGTTFVVAVPDATDASQYNYFIRLGAMDGDIEKHVASSAPIKGGDEGWPSSDGAVLFAKDSYTIVAPQMNTIVEGGSNWSGTNLAVTTDSTLWNKVQTASLNAGGRQYSYVSELSSAFTNGIAATTIAGISNNIVTGVYGYSVGGISTTFVTGINAAVTSGVTISINNSEAQIGTRNGSISVSGSVTKSAADSIELYAASPAAIAAKSAIETATTLLKTSNAVVQAATILNSIATGVALDVEGTNLTKQSEHVTSIMEAQGDAAEATAGIMLMSQIVAAVTAISVNATLKASGGQTSVAGLELSGTEAKLFFALGAASLTMGAGAKVPSEELAELQQALSAAQLLKNVTYQTALAANFTSGFSEYSDANIASADAQDALDKATDAAAALPLVTLNSTDIVINAEANLTLRAGASLILEVGETSVTLTPAAVEMTSGAITLLSESFVASAELVQFDP